MMPRDPGPEARKTIQLDDSHSGPKVGKGIQHASGRFDYQIDEDNSNDQIITENSEKLLDKQ